MGNEGKAAVTGPWHTLFSAGSFAGWTDGELLDRFIRCPDEVGERAFASLVERHGAAVLRICRGVLEDPHDADDAFQATFLVLARRARTIRDRDAVGHWLLGVAYRVAGCARAALVRRRTHERRAAESRTSSIAEEEPADWGPLLREELGRLPEKFRMPLVLCYLEGSTQEEVARRLGWPLGTVRSRLARGRERLRRRLIVRGMAPTVAAIAVGSWREAGAVAVPRALAERTARAAAIATASPAATVGAVSTAVATLTGEVVRTMIRARLKMNAATLLMAGLITTGAGVVAGQGGAFPGQGPARVVEEQAAEAGASKARPDEPRLFILTVDRAKAASLGLTPQDVMKNVAAAFQSSIPADRPHFWMDPADKDRCFVNMKGTEGNVGSVGDLLDIAIDAPAVQPAGPILLRTLITLTRTTRRQLESDVAAREADLESTRVALGRAEARVADARAALAAAQARLKALTGAPEPPAAGEESRTPRALYESLVREYDEARRAYLGALRAERSADTFDEARKKDPDEAEFSRRFLLLAKSHPRDAVAVDAINWIFAIGGQDTGPHAEQAVDLLIKEHLPHGRFGPACRDLAFIADRNAERLFRAALEQSQDREVCGWSTFGLAQCLLVRVVRDHPADPRKAFEEAETLYQRAGEEYGNLEFPRRLRPNLARRTVRLTGIPGTAIEAGRNTLADFAGMKRMMLLAHRDLVVGKPAYEIEGKDVDGEPMKLSDYRGRVVVLVFYVSGDRPFKQMVPHLRALAGRMRDKPFALLGISGDADRGELKTSLSRERIDWRSWWDDGHVIWNGAGPIWARWDISGAPTIYVLDHRGVIRYKGIEGDPLDAAVETLLKEREILK